MKIEIPQLTFTRFLAAISIVLFHYAALIFPFNIPVLHYFISHANLGVCYFFVLSGFILSIVYDADFFSTPGALKKFFIARIARIYPAYLIALLLSITSVWLYQHEDFSMSSALSNVLLLQAWIPIHIDTYNLPAWSLSVEVFFYLIFPFLIYKLFKESFAKSAILALITWASTFMIYMYFFHPASLGDSENSWINPVANPLMQVANFIIGMAGGIAYRQHKFVSIKKYSSLYLSVSIMLMMLFFFIPNPIVENACDVILAPLFLLFIISLAYHQGFLSRVLSNRFLVYLGDISYGIYILQVPLALWYSRLLLKAGIILTDDVILKYSFIVFLIFFSALSYSFIEKPVRGYLRLRRVEELKS